MPNSILIPRYLVTFAITIVLHRLLYTFMHARESLTLLNDGRSRQTGMLGQTLENRPRIIRKASKSSQSFMCLAKTQQLTGVTSNHLAPQRVPPFVLQATTQPRMPNDIVMCIDVTLAENSGVSMFGELSRSGIPLDLAILRDGQEPRRGKAKNGSSQWLTQTFVSFKSMGLGLGLNTTGRLSLS